MGYDEPGVKLDLHAHCFEALGSPQPSREAVGRIVDAIKEKGLDGIAITEHGNKSYGFETRDIVKRFFHDEVLIIPGQELHMHFTPVVVLYLPGDLVFRFIAHPGSPLFPEEHLDDVHGIEIQNGNQDIDRERVEAVAQKHNLLLLSNSDAHLLERLGLYYNELEIDELCSRVERGRGG